MAKIDNFNVRNFISRFKGGARPNQFMVEVSLPPRLRSQIRGSGDAQNDMKFMIQAASIPESTIGTIPVSFTSAKIKIPGDRDFSPWNVTVYNDENFIVRDALEQWSDLISGHVDHDRADEIQTLTDLMSDAEVHHLDKNHNIIKTYNFTGIWPATIGEIALGFDQNDTVETFPVTFNYQWWESTTTRNNTGGIEGSDKAGQNVI